MGNLVASLARASADSLPNIPLFAEMLPSEDLCKLENVSKVSLQINKSEDKFFLQKTLGSLTVFLVLFH